MAEKDTRQRTSKRRQSDWRENAVLWGACIGSIALGLPLAAYTQDRAPALVPIGAFAALVLAGVFGLLAWRIRRRRLATGGAAFFFTLTSAWFAIVHGWMQQVEVIFALAALAYAIVFFVFVIRLGRAQGRLTRAILETNQPEPAPGSWPSAAALLADATPPVVLYPQRRKVALYLAGQLLLALAAAGLLYGSILFWRNGSGAAVVIGILGAVVFGLGTLLLVGVLLPMIVYRLIVRRPAVILTQRGLIDHASAIATGVGPVPWDEVAGSLIYATPRRLWLPPYRYLILMPAHPRALLARLSPLTRFLLRLTASQVASTALPGRLTTIHIPAWLLPISLDELEGQIGRYVPLEPIGQPGAKEEAEPSATE